MAAALLLWPGGAFATDAILSDDTYVSNTSQTVGTNYGQVNNLPLSSTTRIYLRFDFSALPNGVDNTVSALAVSGAIVQALSAGLICLSWIERLT